MDRFPSLDAKDVLLNALFDFAAMDSDSFPLKIHRVLSIGRDLHGDHLVRPNMMSGAPHLAEGAFANECIEYVFRLPADWLRS
jgi:hypothetical protein